LRFNSERHYTKSNAQKEYIFQGSNHLKI